MSELLVAERRFTPRAPEMREDGGVKRIAGYASVFRRRSRDLGGFIEQVDNRAFDQAMTSGWPGVVCRYNHNDDFVLGTTDAGTLSLSVDGTGLFYDVVPPSFRGDIIELCQRGDVTKSSFAFMVPDNGDAWERSGPGGMPLRTLLNLDLVDVAPVLKPAYPDATAMARSCGGDGLALSIARYAHADPEEVRGYLEEEDWNVARFFKRSDRPSAPKPPTVQEDATVTDVPEDKVEDRAVLSGSERSGLPDSDFAYIEPGHEKVDGKTPDKYRHFPVHDAAHVRNALARIAQGAEFGKEALPKVKAAAKRLGVSHEEQDNIVTLVEEMRGSLPDWLPHWLDGERSALAPDEERAEERADAQAKKVPAEDDETAEDDAGSDEDEDDGEDKAVKADDSRNDVTPEEAEARSLKALRAKYAALQDKYDDGLDD